MYFVDFRGLNARYVFVSRDADEISSFVSYLLGHSRFNPLYGIQVGSFLYPSIREESFTEDIEDFDGFKVYVRYDESDDYLGDGDPLYAELEAEMYREAREDEEESISSFIII